MGAQDPLSTSRVVLVDDGQGSFGPLVDLRPVFGLRTGAFTTGERLTRRFGPPAAVRVPPPLADLAAEAYGVPANRLPDGDEFLVLNGRLRSCHGWARPGIGEAVVGSDGALIAARMDRSQADQFLRSGELADDLRTAAETVPMLGSPWDLLDGLALGIAEDIATLEGDPEYERIPSDHPSRVGSHPVLIHRSAAIAPQVVFDATHGPIVVGEKAVVRPFSVLCGPSAIGPGSTIGDRSLIKANTTCGPQCRLGGELGGTSIVGHSNKAHDGHLGDAVVGEWVNFGAGTDNSNLLNTYGEVSVRLEPTGPRMRTGRIFFGSVVGDHAKFAIGTRLMTGTVVGTGAMIAASRPPASIVRRFAWITDEGERQYQLAKFIDVAKTVMARRGRVPGPAYLARLAALHGAA